MAFTKNKDVDILTLNLLSDYELSRVCQVNKDAKKLCERDELWMQRFDQRYGKIMGNIEQVRKEFAVTSWAEFYKNFVRDTADFNSMIVEMIPSNLKIIGTLEAIEEDDTKTIDAIEEEFFTGILRKPEMMKYFSITVRTDPSYFRIYTADFSNPNRLLYFAGLIDTNDPKVQQSWEILNKEIYQHPPPKYITVINSHNFLSKNEF